MVVVRCLILCSKFAKNRLSSGLRQGTLQGAYSTPRPPSWIMGKGGERRDGRAGGEGRKEKE